MQLIKDRCDIDKEHVSSFSNINYTKRNKCWWNEEVWRCYNDVLGHKDEFLPYSEHLEWLLSSFFLTCEWKGFWIAMCLQQTALQTITNTRQKVKVTANKRLILLATPSRQSPSPKKLTINNFPLHVAVQQWSKKYVFILPGLLGGAPARWWLLYFLDSFSASLETFINWEMINCHSIMVMVTFIKRMNHETGCRPQ